MKIPQTVYSHNIHKYPGNLEFFHFLKILFVMPLLCITGVASLNKCATNLEYKMDVRYSDPIRNFFCFIYVFIYVLYMFWVRFGYEIVQFSVPQKIQET